MKRKTTKRHALELALSAIPVGLVGGLLSHAGSSDSVIIGAMTLTAIASCVGSTILRHIIPVPARKPIPLS
jgi:O-antigen/teichoic acid export membrane protein